MVGDRILYIHSLFYPVLFIKVDFVYRIVKIGINVFSILTLAEPDDTCNVHMYANDAELFESTRIENIEFCIDSINYDLQKIVQWTLYKSFRIGTQYCL